jgi:hypothetical protein
LCVEKSDLGERKVLFVVVSHELLLLITLKEVFKRKGVREVGIEDYHRLCEAQIQALRRVPLGWKGEAEIRVKKRDTF